jgi:secretion/DNA translocation related TadE-like protein
VRQSSRSIVSERGAGTILAIGILIALFGIFSVGTVFGSQILGFTRLQAQTDSIALAAADALRGVSSGYPCIVAKDIAANNQIELKRCRIVGFEVFIETSLILLGISQSAKARAGPGES